MERCSLSGQELSVFGAFVAGSPRVSGNSSFAVSPWESASRAGLAHSFEEGVWPGCSVGDPHVSAFRSDHIWREGLTSRRSHSLAVLVEEALFLSFLKLLGYEGVLCAGRGRAPDIQLLPEPTSGGSSSCRCTFLHVPCGV